MKMNLTLPVVALLVGSALGYCLAPARIVAGEPKGETKSTAKAPIGDDGSRASIAALRARIADLERQLSERTDARTETRVSEQTVARADGGNRDPFGAAREWMENLRNEDPARYAQMTNGYARMRQRRQARTRSRQEFLASVDTSRMNAAAKKTHDDYQAAMSRHEELESRIHQENLTDGERREIFEQMRESGAELRRLGREERDNLLQATANSLGFQGDDAREIAETIREVYDATEGGGPLFGGGRGFGGRGRGAARP